MAYEDPNEDMPLVLLAETENFAVLLGQDDGGEPVYNLEFGTFTVHLFREEWQGLVELIKEADRRGEVFLPVQNDEPGDRPGSLLFPDVPTRRCAACGDLPLSCKILDVQGRRRPSRLSGRPCMRVKRPGDAAPGLLRTSVCC